MILAGKHCLITGGGSGIGRATAFRFAEEGAAVYVLDRDEKAIKETIADRRCQGVALAGDVTDAESVGFAVDAMCAVDIVVCNAAISLTVDVLSDPIEAWRKVIEVNLWGVVHTCRSAAKRMIQSGKGGRIIIVSSIQSTLAEIGSAPYGMAKAAINQLARQLANEWASNGILVNVVAPGFVETPMSCASGENELESDWCKQFFFNADRPRVPLLRAAQPEEIAEAILFFANPKNTYCTGSVLVVDGGLSITL